MFTHIRGKELITVEDYILLSSNLSYQLEARHFKRRALLGYILGPCRSEQMENVLLKAIDYLREAYKEKRRNIGSAAVLHPLRTTAILVNYMPEPTIMDLVCALLHDKDEDLLEEKLKPDCWEESNKIFEQMLEFFEPDSRDYLNKRIDLLARKDNQSYNEYLGLIIENAEQMPELLHVKLADRLDNTFDTNLQQPSISRYNFFRNIFDILFVPNFSGVKFNEFHFLPPEEEGTILLAQLFKDAIVMSVLRSAGYDKKDVVNQHLFDALAIAGIREAQWIVLELFASFITDVTEQRRIVRDAMDYCCGGGLEAVRSVGGLHRLDGLIMEYYAMADSQMRKEKMRELFEDHHFLAEVLIVFVAIFANFLHDPDYYIKGISVSGITPIE